ncbi:protein adenylyltransferase SelO [Thiomicrospira sp. S5]|uniref:protein adenylyltransferase SelO n=1 Tax=Thiomicrospira sp. S5 TaxID=1803865 RepID=UPI000F8A1A7D|nr:YdiU family protein [Thiomicrospira sp. S5]AZR81163.1 hypothetical protein AYJ59_01920 [Thiomicrospira sp. S5]
MLQHPYLELPKSFFQPVWPEPQQNARLVAVNRALMQEIDCDLSDEQLLALTAGQLEDASLAEFDLQPLAQKYTGHQFGYYNPDLGDGRGVLLGRWEDKNGQAWDFHLKGAGRTPYSRRGDGRAVLRSVIREYLASEALYGLGVPTTRALSIATSDEQVQRETFETRASLMRVTPSHIRFGHFQWAASKGPATFEFLTNFVVEHHYPELQSLAEPQRSAALLKTVCERTAVLMAKWQAVGFNHGVMNSDNMSILGETFDFGPYAFFDDFQIEYICNHSDYEGRYAYNQQPKIGVTNCQLLAHAFDKVLDEAAQNEALEAFVETYNRQYIDEMNRKIGLHTVQPDDKNLIGDLLVLMDQHRVDFSLFFRRLAKWNQPDEGELMALLNQPGAFVDWFQCYDARLQQEGVSESERQQRILAANPAIVLRNYIAQGIIEAAENGDYQPLEQWVEALHSPFEEHPGLAEFQKPPSPEQKGLQLSCSS